MKFGWFLFFLYIREIREIYIYSLELLKNSAHEWKEHNFMVEKNGKERERERENVIFYAFFTTEL